MPGGTGLVLGPEGAGLMEGDNLSDAGRRKLCFDCAAIMAAGNQNGTGLLATGFLPIPVYPVPGPKVILNPILKPQGENLFWFDPDPLAAAGVLPQLLDPKSEFQKIFVDGIYVPLARMLNLAGAPGTLGPIFDPTVFVDLSKPAFKDIDIPALPGILAKIVINVPLFAVPLTQPAALKILVDDFGINPGSIISIILPLLTKPPSIPLPPIPPIPIPPVPIIGVADPSYFLKFATGIFKCPVDLFLQLALPGGLIGDISISPPDLLAKIIKLIVDVFLGLLSATGLLIGVPKLLLSFMMVLVKDLAVMLLCLIVGKMLGTGLIVKIVGKLGGLS